MIVSLLYTDVILTCNLMNVMFHHYTDPRLRCSRLSPYFSIPINILQQINLSHFSVSGNVKLQWASNFRWRVHILLADCRFLLELPRCMVWFHIRNNTVWSSGCSQFWVCSNPTRGFYLSRWWLFWLAMVSNWKSRSREILPLFHKDSMYF